MTTKTPEKTSAAKRIAAILIMPPIIFCLVNIYAAILSVGFILSAFTGSKDDYRKAGNLAARLFGGFGE